MVCYVDKTKEAAAQGVVGGVLASKVVWGSEDGEASEGMLRAAEWEEDEDRPAGGEGWKAEDVCFWPWGL